MALTSMAQMGKNNNTLGRLVKETNSTYWKISTEISLLYLYLLMAFYPKILGGDRDLRIVFLLENEWSFSGADNVRRWGNSNPTRWLKNL